MILPTNTANMNRWSTVSFSSVPKVSPSLGLKVGHDRRDVAAARKPRPPTRKTASLQVRQLHVYVLVYIRYNIDRNIRILFCIHTIPSLQLESRDSFIQYN